MRPPIPLGPAARSSHIYLKIRPDQMGLFRFLLEAYDNLAQFTVLTPNRGLLKLIFSPHQEREVQTALQAISALIALQTIDLPANQS